jgi:hypothetical protein
MGLINLRKLWLDNNQITNIEKLEVLTGLQKLSLCNNPIINVKKLDDLDELYDFHALNELYELEELSLYDKKIIKIQKFFDELTGEQYAPQIRKQIICNLKGLSLNYKQFTTIKGLDTLSSLKELSLSNLFNHTYGNRNTVLNYKS